MTNENAYRANKGELLKYIGHQQDRAIFLSGLIEALEHLHIAQECENGRNALIRIAAERAAELADSLDSANLPKGEPS